MDTYDLIVIGGGPGGAAAGIYAARKKLKTLSIAFKWGGQSAVSTDIQNWVGTKKISGTELAISLKEHLTSYEGPDLKVMFGHKVQKIAQSNNQFTVEIDSGEQFNTKTVLIATGADRRRLTAPGAKEFDQKGITYCASCDGPLFAGKDVVVIGGGNAAFESAAQLLAYCKSVTLLNRSEKFRADKITIEKVKKDPKFKIITNAEVTEFKGGQFIESLTYKDTITGKAHELKTGGVFVEIGLVPATYFAKDLLELNQNDQIIVDPRTQRTSITGIWAAGDCTDGRYHQNNIAAGDAVKALEDLYSFLHLTK
ncbi:MAG: FAD-dependent oxidoreductase [Patescibacteria group bacterium]|nr:FAD-dependent oxidoreductase [Patescibacteria group bacterium]